MKSSVRVALLGLLAIILLGAAAWYYLFGPNLVSAAELMPADTIAFASVPNGTRVGTEYRSSKLKQLADSPTAQPLFASAQDFLGPKNVALFNALLPCLSGQSFVAITHFDPQQPAHLAIIAALRPKFGLDKFDGFVAQVKTVYATELQQATVGTGQVDGIDYQSVQGPGAADKICVAHVGGWIVTSWGEAPLHDFIERLHKKSVTPSLAQSAAYQSQVARVGKDAEGFVYLDAAGFLPVAAWWLPAKTTPTDYLSARLKGVTTLAMGTQFLNGEIADRFSVLGSTSAPDLGPCPFDTLKFTGPDTHFYWATNIDWAGTWKAMQTPGGDPNPVAATFLHFLQNWAQGASVDMDRNIVGALGPEFSVQAEWSADSSYPDLGVIVKVAKPDDLKPVIAAMVDTVRRAYAQSAVVNEIAVNGNNFATLKFIQPMPISPTLTEDGPYFGLFLTETHAARSLSRDGTIGLSRNDDFNRQVGNGRQGAGQIFFLDTPTLLNHAYGMLSPYLSLAAMFNPAIGSWIKTHPLPPDLNGLGPVGTWSFTTTADAQGFQGTSISGIGNQGVYLGSLMNTAATMPMVQNQMQRLAILMAPPASAPAPVPPVLPPTAPPATGATNSDISPASPDASKPPL